MRVLLDTNILLRLDDTTHIQHSFVQNAVEQLGVIGHDIVLVPQVLYEYWVVATRPVDVNGLGLEPSVVDKLISDWLEFFTLLRDERGIFSIWRELVSLQNVRGKTAHDTRLVAAMQRHAVSDLLTLNTADFIRYQTIQIWTPSDVIAGRIPV
jgi:predicted nucleic acid-binding protein